VRLANRYKEATRHCVYTLDYLPSHTERKHFFYCKTQNPAPISQFHVFVVVDPGSRVCCQVLLGFLALAGTALFTEHLLSVALCPPSLVLVEFAPAVATEQDGDANETKHCG